MSDKDDKKTAEEAAKQTALLQKMADISKAQSADLSENKKSAQEELKLAKSSIKLETKNAGALSKLLGFIGGSGSKDKEEKNEEGRFRKSMLGAIKGMGSGIAGMGKKMGEKAKGGIKGLGDILGKTALALAIPALMLFMNSPYFDKLAKFVKNDLLPGIQNIYEMIKPIAVSIAAWVSESALPIIMTMLMDSFKALTTFFSDVFARFSGWSDMSLREKIGAVLGIFTNITELLGKLVGNMIEAVVNLFGGDGKKLREKYWDPIAKFFTDIVDSVMLIFTDPVAGIKKLFATLWSAAKGIGGFIFDIAIKPAWNWVKSIFGFGDDKKVPAEEGSSDGTLWGWIKGIPGKVWTWIKSIFGFSSGAEEDPKADIGETKGFFSKVLHAIIPAGIFTFLEDPILWFWTNILGIPNKDGKKPSAAEAAEAIATGKADGIFAKVMGAFLPQGMIEFILDPIDWIFVNVLKLGNKDGKKESTGQKAGMILGTAVGMFEKVLKAILPDGLVDMIMSPINWLFRKVLKIEPNAVLDSVSEAHGVDKGDATGLWQSMLDAILPAGLARFLGDPIGYIFTDILGLADAGAKLPSTKEKSKVIAGVAVGMFESLISAILPAGVVKLIMSPINWLFEDILGIDVGKSMKSAEEAAGVSVGETKGLFASILGAILPAGLVDLIRAPLKWVFGKLGINIGESMASAKEAAGIELGDTKGLFKSVLDAILPEGLVDFLMNPLKWIMSYLGIDLTPKTEKLDLGTASKGAMSEEEKLAKRLENREKLISSVTSDLPWFVPTDAAEWVMNKVLPMLGMQSGGLAKMGQFAVVGESGPELVRFKRPAVVANNEQMHAGRDFAMNAMRAATSGSAGGGGGTTVVNNTSVVAPMSQQSSAVSVSMPIGASDPFTKATRAY